MLDMYVFGSGRRVDERIGFGLYQSKKLGARAS